MKEQEWLTQPPPPELLESRLGLGLGLGLRRQGETFATVEARESRVCVRVLGRQGCSKPADGQQEHLCDRVECSPPGLSKSQGRWRGGEGSLTRAVLVTGVPR